MKALKIAIAIFAVAAVAYAGVASANCGACGACGAGKAHAGCMAGSMSKGDCPGWDAKATKSFEAKVVSFDKHDCEGCKTTYTELVVMMGEEKVAVQKMKTGQLHGAAVSVVGLSTIAPDLATLNLPMVFSSKEEVVATREAMADRFANELWEKGYKLVSLIPVGYPAGPAPKVAKRPVSELLHWDSF